MSNPPEIRVSQSLALVENLETTVSDFVKKEETLVREERLRLFEIKRLYQKAIEDTEETLGKQIEHIDLLFDDENERVREIYDKRRTRAERAHLVATRRLPLKVREVREDWLGDLQMKRFRAERKLTADLTATDETSQAFTEQLTEFKNRLSILRKRATQFFGGYVSFQKMLEREPASEESRSSKADLTQLMEQLSSSVRQVESQLKTFHQHWLPRFFAQFPLPGILLVLLFGAAALSYALGFNGNSHLTATAAFVATAIATSALFQIGKKKASPLVAEIVTTLAKSKTLLETCRIASLAKHESDRKRLQADFDQADAILETQKSRVDEIEQDFEKRAQNRLETQLPRIALTMHVILNSRLRNLSVERRGRMESYKNEAAERVVLLLERQSAESAEVLKEMEARWESVAADWKHAMEPLAESISSVNQVAEKHFPAWNADLVQAWKPAGTFASSVKFGELHVDLTQRKSGVPQDARLTLPLSANVSIPLSLTFPQQGSLLFETKGSGEAEVIDTFNNVVLRLLANTPPGKLSFTIVDPVGLGENFAGLMHLSDYEDGLINRRIWTQRDQIEERLSELSEHIEKVIQMYLRNEYANITDYNAKAGSVAEKYHFLVVADFPSGFSETAARKLQSIASSGPRCGVYTLLHWDQRQQLPDGFSPDEVRQNSVTIRGQNGVFSLSSMPDLKANLVLDKPPQADLAGALIHKIGQNSVDSYRVEVPFSQIAPPLDEMWKGDTTSELRVAIGRTGATKHQYLSIGKGTKQHALFAGKTGSGKSTLFHVIITNLALTCSPDQVEFYLIDFKKGVEFKCYATKQLPHARVVAIESDREFALSVLHRVDEELKRRGDLFRKLGVQDVAGYKRSGRSEPMPRSLLLIDEFQEFFVEDDSIAQTASLLFDRIVRQGRAFGIHVILGSQTLGGAYSLARATLGQMVIRVALQCNEADAYLIMDENNAAPRLLSRPGEGIYNDAAGAVEGNSPFQVVWLPDDDRDRWLDKVNALASEHGNQHSGPIVFEGNAPADITENRLLKKVLKERATVPPSAARCWLGAPNAIKGPTEVVFKRQSGSNLLIVGQREEASLNLLGLSLLALAAQHPVGTAKFIFLHAATPGSAEDIFLKRIVQSIAHEVTIANSQNIKEILDDVSDDLKSRMNGSTLLEEVPTTFLMIHGLHKFKKLRPEDDFSFSISSDDEGKSPGSQFSELITEGSSFGIHLLVTVDTFNNVNRSMSRKALSEFEMRVVFQMSANDSASLIDSPKASNLGLHRALFYNEHEGTLETFRPYASPEVLWLDEVTIEGEVLSSSAV